MASNQFLGGGVSSGSVVPFFRRNQPGSRRGVKKNFKKEVGPCTKKQHKGLFRVKRDNEVFKVGSVDDCLMDCEDVGLPHMKVDASSVARVVDVVVEESVGLLDSVVEDFDDFSMCDEDVLHDCGKKVVVEVVVEDLDVDVQEDAKKWIVSMVRQKVHYFGSGNPSNEGILKFVDEFKSDFSHCPVSRLSVFVVRHGDGWYYGVFDRDIEKLSCYRLKEEVALCFVCSCVDKYWNAVDVSMLSAEFSAESGDVGVNVVNWHDERLPERFAVVDDVDVNCEIEDCLRSNQWRVFGKREFVNAVPALAHYSCNFCDECGGVDMCRHILDDILRVEKVDLGPAMFFVRDGVYSLLCLRECPSICAVSSPHVRYAIARSLLLISDDPRLEFWKCASEKMCFDLYPNRVIAQGFFGDAIDSITSIFGVVLDIFTYVPKQMYYKVRDIIYWCLTSMKDFAVSGFLRTVESMFDKLKEKVNNALTGVWESVRPFLSAILKTVVRVCMGYRPMDLLMEFAWDNIVFQEIIGGFIQAELVLMAQGPEDFSCALAALSLGLFVAMGKLVPKFKLMSDLMSCMILTAGAFNRSMLWDQFGALKNWFDGDEKSGKLAIFAMRYPSTCAMISVYERMVANDSVGKMCSSDRVELGYLYSRYLVERRKFGLDSREVEAFCIPVLKFIASHGVQQVDRVRARPPCLMFWGKSGLGKSKIIGKLAALIANKHKERYTPGDVFSMSNAVYFVNVGDDYVSGYDNQDIWIFDEWLQEKDSEQKPSKSVNLLFSLISTNPCKLNMAAIDDKGKLANVALVMGATNINLTGNKLGNFIKSVHDTKALEGRVSIRVEVLLKDGFVVQQSRVCRVVDKVAYPLEEDVDQGELYDFVLTRPDETRIGGDLKDGKWSWKALVNFVDREYTKCVEYNPEALPLDMSVFDSEKASGKEEEDERERILDDVILSEGFWDFLPTWKKTKVSFLNRNGGVFDTEVEECYQDDPDAIPGIKVLEAHGGNEYVFGEGEGKQSFHGDECFVKVMKQWDLPSLGLSLLMLTVALVAAVPIARKLKSAVESSVDLASVVIDGVKYWYNGEKGCYSAEGGGIVEHNGQKFFRVYTKGGYQFYPQGPAADMLRLLDNQRTIQQMPVIEDALFSVIVNGECAGNAFAITDCRLVLPMHIAQLVLDSGCLLANGKICVSLERVGEHVVGYRVDDLGGDCAVLELEAYKLNGVRNNLTKISRSTPVSGLCRQLYRNGKGFVEVVDTTYGDAAVEIQYTTHGRVYGFQKKYARYTPAPGHQGKCGCIYVNLTERPSVGNAGIVLGFHVAANCTVDKRVFRVMDDVVFSLNNIKHSAYPPLDNPKGGLGELFGMESAKTSMSSQVYPDGRLGETPVPAVLGAPLYKVALLKAIEKPGGEFVDPMLNGLSSLDVLAKREIDYPIDLEVCARVVGRKLAESAIICNPDWPATFSGAGFLPSIQRGAASGPPWTAIGTTKDVMCLSFDELVALGMTNGVVPNERALQVLDELVSRILTGREYEAACGASIKEEPRLASKVEIGASRLFAGAPVHEFLLQRRFFMGVLATFLKKNVAVHSALGLDPSHYGEIHKMMENMKNGSLAMFDYKKMDQSFTPKFMALVSKIIRSIAIGFWVGDEIHSAEDYIRSVLLYRLSFSRLLVGKEIIEPKGGHPSGSALTTIINIVADILVFTYSISKMTGKSFEEVLEEVFMLFLGDDSVVCMEDAESYDLRIVVETARKIGFTLTAGDKSECMRWEKLANFDRVSRSEYEFLSRAFTKTDGVLSMERLPKMMMFCEEHRALETVPQAISSFQDELARYERTGQVDWLERMVVQVKHFGFNSMEEFLGMNKIEIVQVVLGTFVECPEKMRVSVPPYNRKIMQALVAQGPDEFVAQGPGDDEPGDAGNEEDAEFLGEVVTLEMENVHTDHRYLQDHMDEVNYASKEVFGRPIVVFTGTTGVVSDVQIVKLSAASAYFFKNFNAQAKLANSVFMRCTFCVKVIVASGPFNLGKLLLSFRPSFVGATDMIMATADPCTEIDLAAATSAIVKFTTCLPGNWMMVEKFVDPVSIAAAEAGFDYGIVQLWTLTPPAVSTPVTVYCWLEDVELRGAGFTHFTLAAQGKDSKGKKEEGKGGKKAGSSKSHVGRNYEGEMMMKKWDWKIENTPDWLNTVGASVETIGGCVETIEESILGPAGDFVEKGGEAVGGAAAVVFGASVPPPSTHIECFMQAPVWNQAQMMTNTPSIRMSVVQSQKSVIPRTLFTTKADEMIIKEYVSRMSVIKRFPWSGVDATGTTLAVWNVMPGVVAEATVLLGQFSVSPSPLAFIAGMFRYWRGTLKYRLAIAKTAFHTGTLEIVWQMGLNSNTPATSAQDALSQRFIWDVTQSSSIEFEVPYVARTPWTQVYFTNSDNVVSATDLTTGRIYVNVINPLTNSSGIVPANVYLILYISGGEDIEFGMPGKHAQLSAVVPSPVSYGEDYEYEREAISNSVQKFVAQGGPFGEEDTRDGLSGVSIRTLRSVPKTSMWAHLTTMGERVLSTRLLIKRFGAPVAITSSITLTQAALNNWFMGYLSFGFSFYTGSWRVNFIINPPDYDVAAFPFYWTLNWNSSATPFEDGSARMSIAPWSNATVLEVPWYSNFAFRRRGDPGIMTLEGPNPPTSLMQFCAGDDFSYGFQVGCQPLTYQVALPPALY